MLRRNEMTQDNNEEPIAHPLNDNPWLKKIQALVENMEAGRITQAEFERKHRALMIELQHHEESNLITYLVSLHN